MSTDERLYQFATQYLVEDEKYRGAIPPFEEISHEDLVLAALAVFYRNDVSAEETIWGMEKLGVSRYEMEDTFLRLAKQFSELN